MNINQFFTQTLGAQLRNPRWSWGALDPLNNRVYLRVWEDQSFGFDGGERIRIGFERPRRKSNGFSERNFHIELIRSGAEGYGVVCEAADPDTTEARKIARFDEHHLVRFGEIVTEGDSTYGVVAARIPVTELSRPQTAQSGLADDLRAIARKPVDSTTREALVNARVGQGQFRYDVLGLWDNRCAVTGSSTLDAIRASHVKPWRDSKDHERLDPSNGLPLLASLDALFDAGLISFVDTGEMIVSSGLAPSEHSILGLGSQRLRKPVSEALAEYLAHHRAQVFRT